MKAYNPQLVETYYVEMNTPNTSFLKMAALLQEMGVKNCYFHLKLLDKSLVGVDPYDENLDEETRFRIIRECSRNRWYFYRNVYRIPENGKGTDVGGGTPFILNRGNLAYLWAMEMNISVIMILPRQIGKTWAGCADFTWTHQFCRSSTMLHFNKDQKNANDNLQRIQSSIRLLPTYLQHSNEDNLDPTEKRRVKNNEKTILNAISSRIEAMASAGNEAKADTLARGKTASKIWYDEMSFIFFNSVIYTAATPAYEQARETAIENHAPYAISITTTPGDLATPHGAYVHKMINDAIRFNESFYDLPRKKLYDRINNTPDKIPYVFIQFNYRQLGKTDEWYLSRFKNLHDPLRARREYLLEWINSNGNSPFDPDDLDLIREYAEAEQANRTTVRVNKYFELSVYSEYRGKKPVIIGVDVAGSNGTIGRDSSAVVVVNPETLKPMAIFKSNMIESSKLRKLLTTIVKKLYPNCVLAIENNSIGGPLISELRENPLMNRVLYKEKKTKVMDMGTNSVTRKRKRETMEYGYNTGPVTRPQMMEILESVVHNAPAHVGFPELYDEILYLEIRNGRIDHSPSTHDDVTMAYLGALWVVRHGKGLKGKGIYYNISDGLESEEEPEDYTESYRFADRLLRGTKKERLEAETEFLEFMTTPQPVVTTKSLDDAARQEYFAELDRVQGITDEEDDRELGVSKETSELLLRNYNALARAQGFGSSDMVPNLLDPVGESAGFGFLDKDRYW